ncbi:MAG: putative N-acetylmannosamine-6-phosphate 2-epimerase [Rubellimicrobium sp.]|nr:putative N-acetylmannosamine-6-phosphate 2-epimerase [Rubellimicrobium sp.]
MLNGLKGRLIVSCQPVPGGALDRPEIVAAFARAALDGGAAGLRIEGLANLAAVRAVTEVPIIGLIKTDRDDTPVRITPLLDQVEGLVAQGADIVAVDATDRQRPVPLADLLAAIHRGGALAMADCATEAEGRAAQAMGFDILGSTMAGYTGGPVPEGPDLDLVRALAGMGAFTIAEGRYQTPAQAAAAIRAGADAVVAGSAITRPEHVTDWFAQAIAGAGRDPR